MKRLILVVLLASSGVAQTTAGTHSVDDTSRADALRAQITEAESALEKLDYKGAEVKL